MPTVRHLLLYGLVFQRPEQKLPYLFFFGPQESGKSAFHNSLGLLMSRGHVEARFSILSGFNGESDGAILPYVEEVDLSTGAEGNYDRMKELITGDYITINAKYVDPYKVVSCLHWVQVANKRSHCPVFEDGTRVVVVHVAEKPQEDIPWTSLLKPMLQKEAPDFLRSLLDLTLPARNKGIGRLSLPVLDTEAKRALIADRGQGDVANPNALLQAIDGVLSKHRFVYEGLVSELLNEIGDGPWASTYGAFGKQLRIALEDARSRGTMKYRFETTKRGQMVHFQWDADPDKLDPKATMLAELLASDTVCDAWEMFIQDADVT